MNKKGFTLVELLIYIALLTILLGIITRVFTGITQVQLESESFGSVEEDSRYLFARLAYDITRASDIVAPAVPGDLSDTLILVIDGIANSYSVSGTTLTLANGSGVDALNSVKTRISDLSFLRVGSSVQITYIITSVSQDVSGPDTKQVTTTIALR